MAAPGFRVTFNESVRRVACGGSRARVYAMRRLMEIDATTMNINGGVWVSLSMVRGAHPTVSFDPVAGKVHFMHRLIETLSQ